MKKVLVAISLTLAASAASAAPSELQASLNRCEVYGAMVETLVGFRDAGAEIGPVARSIMNSDFSSTGMDQETLKKALLHDLAHMYKYPAITPRGGFAQKQEAACIASIKSVKGY